MIDAVIDTRANPEFPDVYLFEDRRKALDFKAWLIDTDPDQDGSEEFEESVDAQVTVVTVVTPPEHWDRSL